MKNLFSMILLAGLLAVAGCASDSSQATATGETGNPRWQFRTFPIVANNDFEFRSKILALNQQGWTYVSVSSTTRNPSGAVVMVLMKRPNQ